jgi:hypothetical protein
MPHLVSGSRGLAWSAGKGIIAALRRADETPGAWQGFRPLQFMAAVGSGAGGGPLVDSQDALLGIITKGIAPGSGRVAERPMCPGKQSTPRAGSAVPGCALSHGPGSWRRQHASKSAPPGQPGHHVCSLPTRTNPLARGTLRVYTSGRFFPTPYFICGIMGFRYAGPTSRERSLSTCPEAN